MAATKSRGRGLSTTGAPRAQTDVWIVEEYIPEYRRRFFELLEAALEPESIRLTVAVGMAPAARALKSDAVEEMPSARRVPTQSVSLAGRRLTFRRLSKLGGDPDLVVVDQALRHLENYPLLLGQRRGPKVGLWGHGARLAKRSTRLERLLERRALRAAHWFFAYTQSGADHVAADGFPREHITVVQNTIDVVALARLRDEISAEEQQLLREELELPPANVCLYLGALEPSKRLEFLLEACSIVASRIPEFALIVAGDGPERELVERSLGSRPWLRFVGRATGKHKARLGSVSDLLVMPGSVGLVAVDSFALRTPIVTTSWPHHGPELDYLEDHINARVSADDIAEFARTVEETLLSRDELDRLTAACVAAAQRYSLDRMVANFAGGIRAALRTPRR